MEKIVKLTENDLKNVITECVNSVYSSLTETTRRQKAVQSLNGTNKKIRTIAILTSENPGYADDTTNFGGSDNFGSDNADRVNDLENALRVGHYAWFPVNGHYGGDREHSYMVYNISLEDTLYLGRKYGQEAVIFIEDGKCQYWEQDGSGKFEKTHERPMNTRIDMSDADDFYTQVSKAFKFQIPFFDGSDENAEELSKMNEYVCNVINKRILDESVANRRLYACIKAKSGFNRYANRSELYGRNFQWKTRFLILFFRTLPRKALYLQTKKNTEAIY